MIEQITIRNFKSIGEVTVDLSPVTVLIGRSGVGKSNFLRAIRFLRNFLLQGDTAIQREGGWAQIWPFSAPAPLSFSVRFTIPGNLKKFEYAISWRANPTNPEVMFLSAERLVVGDQVVFDRTDKNWIKWPGEGAPPAIAQPIYLNSFPTVSPAVLAYTVWTTGIGWHDFPASVFKQPSTSGGGQAKVSGLEDGAANFLEVIREMSQDLCNQLAQPQILARIKQINPTVESLGLNSLTQPQHVAVAHQVGDRRIRLDLSQESDGFRRYYAHLLALYQRPPKQVLMFEEPENGVFPGALSNLAEEFKKAPAAGRGQVLLTTQSPDLLDGFTPDELRVVELDEKQMTRIRPLDPDQAEALRTQLLEPGELLTVDPARQAPASV